MKIKTNEVILAALFTALTVVGAKINFMLPDIPITLQPIIVILSGCLIGSKAAFLSQLAYLALGLAGVPVFAKPAAGPSYVLQPTFGYLLGFAAAAYIIGIIIEKARIKSLFIFITAVIAGLFIIYIPGILYFYGLMNAYIGKPIGLLNAVVLMLPFAAKDFILGIVSSVFAFQIYKRTARYNRKNL